MNDRAAFRRAIERHSLDDMVRFDETGLVRDLTVMVRPRSAMERLLAEVQPRLIAAIQAETAN